MVGHYSQQLTQYHGFVVESGTYSPIDFPLARYTTVGGIDGDNLVGSYVGTDGRSHGYLFDGANFTTIDPPQTSPFIANGTEAAGISHNRIVGTYIDSSARTHGYVFNGATYTTIDYPGAGITTASDIDGNRIVGTYSIGAVSQGYLYDNGNFTSIVHPLASIGTLALGISGNKIVGYYVDAANSAHGFLYDGASYLTLDVPFTLGHTTIAHGISGNAVVGQYTTNSGVQRGFLVYVPEPDHVCALIPVLLISVLCPRSRRKFLVRMGDLGQVG